MELDTASRPGRDTQNGTRAEVLVLARGAARTYTSGAGPVTALHPADAVVHRQDRIALTGTSGSGKSTMLHLLAGLLSPTAGSVTWPALGPVPHRPGLIGVVFQAPSLLPTLNAVENVELVALLAGNDPVTARTKAVEAMQALDLIDLAPQLPDELSGGQAQRVAIARALAGDPAVIVADEPTGHLDHQTASHVMQVLRAAADRSGAALLVATHDPVVAEPFSTRWTVSDGHLSTGAGPAASRHRYGHEPHTRRGLVPNDGPALHPTATSRTTRRPR